MMNKLRFLSLILALLLFAALGAGAAPKYQWKLASVLPESHPVHKALVYFADTLEQRTGGEVKITLFPAGQLGGEKDFIEGVKLGSIELTKVSSAVMGQYSPTLQVVSLPFIWRDADHQHKVMQGAIGQKLAADTEQFGFKSLAYMDAGFRSITTAKAPVYNPGNLKGLKIRVMQSQPLIDTINAFGAIAVPMSQTEVYTALQTKVIDGWENNEPTVLSFNMQEVSPYFSYTRHSSIPDTLVMNKKLFDGLPKNIQDAIVQTANDMTREHNKLWAAMIDETKRQLKAKGMIFNEVTDITKFQAATREIYKPMEAVVGKDLIDSIVNTK
jgi:tripartite ATP-independent transporter DctP family solute receptor